MEIPVNLKYTKDHEWLRVEGNEGYVGITDFAQDQLGDIVFIEVETIGETLKKGESLGTVEAVKTVSDIFMPVSGKILEFNGQLEKKPELVNKEPYKEGWIVKIHIDNKKEIDDLLDAEKYKKICEA